MKKAIAIIGVLVVLLGLTACGKLEKEPTNTPYFETENIENIVFYAYYGLGIGAAGPEENLEEITEWLKSFELTNKKVEPLVGENYIWVEITYKDATRVKSGLSSAVVEGVEYQLKSDKAPNCLDEIIAKTSI